MMTSSLVLVTQRIIRTQVSASLSPHHYDLTIINEHYHFMTSSDRFSVPARLAVKSNLTAWYCQNLSNRALNALTSTAEFTILDLLCACFDTHKEHLVVFIIVQNVLGIVAIVSIISRFLISRVSFENACLCTPQNWRLGEFYQ